MRLARLLPTAAVLLVGLAVWVGRGVALGPITLQAAQVATLIVAAVALAAASLARRPPLAGLHPTVGALLCAVAGATLLVTIAALLSSIGAPDAVSALRFIMRYVFGIVLVVALLHFLRSLRTLRWLERALLLGATASVAVAALGFAIPALGALTIRYGDRAQGLLNHPNQLAIVLLAVAPIALAVALRSPRRIGGWAALLLVAGGIAFTGSKANLLLLAVSLPALALLAAYLRRGPLVQARTALGLMVAAAAAAAGAYWIVLRFNPRTLATLERLFDDPWSTSTVVSRSEMWGTAVRVGLDHPWFGVGADHARFHLPHSHAHNVVIEFFLTMGAVGLVALIALVSAWLTVAAFSLWIAYTRTRMPFADRLGLLAYPASLLLYVASNQSSDSFGGTTLPIAWIATAMALGHLDVVLKEHASVRDTVTAAASGGPQGQSTPAARAGQS